MHPSKKIRSALISVFYKDKLESIVRQLDALGITIYSTGGTGQFIKSLGFSFRAVEDLTSYPSILGGRVKTLHPKVFGGILGRRDVESDKAEMEKFEIPSIDLVIVDLYPFEETVKAGSSEEEIIEKIDIGGVALIRAAAKNFNDVLIVASKDDYDELEKILKEQNGETETGQRKYFAKKAFEITSAYDDAVFSWFNYSENFSVRSTPKMELRYGENPHQRSAFYGKLSDVFEKLNGKELSYNNLVDAESALLLMEEFKSDKRPVFAVIKHTNACGLATADTLEEAWQKALAADPVSAYGGVLICNREMDLKTAYLVSELFFEVLIAPGYDREALVVLQSKKNRIILKNKLQAFPDTQFKSLLNGILVQTRNNALADPAQLEAATEKKPSAHEMKDMLFAEKAVKHLKSNGIALVKNEQLIGSGTGQTSRVDALRQAIEKAVHFGFDLRGAVMASEAFFPFPDCVQIAHEQGITAVIQPGGSIRDKESVDYCNAHDMAMVLTGVRHFTH